MDTAMFLVPYISAALYNDCCGRQMHDGKRRGVRVSVALAGEPKVCIGTKSDGKRSWVLVLHSYYVDVAKIACGVMLQLAD